MSRSAGTTRQSTASEDERKSLWTGNRVCLMCLHSRLNLEKCIGENSEKKKLVWSWNTSYKRDSSEREQFLSSLGCWWRKVEPLLVFVLQQDHADSTRQRTCLLFRSVLIHPGRWYEAFRYHHESTPRLVPHVSDETFGHR